MKRGFTLVEMLIVTVVIAVMMMVVFKLSSVGTDNDARSKTINRMQRLENAISGYYAAFGSYPPVALHGSRNFYYDVNDNDIQQTSAPNPTLNFDDEYSFDSAWRKIKAACRSQPLAVAYPYPERCGGVNLQDYVSETSQRLTELHNAGEGEYAKNPVLAKLFDALNSPSQLSGKSGDSSWGKMQMFQYGVMSYLLPRYLVMLGHTDSSVYEDFSQWSDNNQIPCRFEDGTPYDDWNDINSEVLRGTGGDQNQDEWKVSLLPSQAITARWMANLEGILSCEFNNRESGGYWLYGVNVKDVNGIPNVDVSNPWPKVYSAGDSQSGTGSGGSQLYVLAQITCCDGWNQEFYYYSPSPYQSYRLWSSGKNVKTFPPWVSPEEISSDQILNEHQDTITEWMADDIVFLRN